MNLFENIDIKNFDDFLNVDQRFCDEQWIFRGESCQEDELKTSLEKMADRFSTDLKDLPMIEEGLLRRFQREAYLHINNPPDIDNDDQVNYNYIEWLALMRHYGVPTRLLDWTYSFFCAVFFAINKIKPNGECVVWIVDFKWLKKRCIEIYPDIKIIFEKDPDLKNKNSVNKLIKSSPPYRAVFRLSPLRLSQRQIIQQNLFLVPGDITLTFNKNFQTICNPEDSKDHFKKVTINCDESLFDKIIIKLHRMNINHSTLFPGLEGLARSLENLIRVPETIVTEGLKDKFDFKF